MVVYFRTAGTKAAALTLDAFYHSFLSSAWLLLSSEPLSESEASKTPGSDSRGELGRGLRGVGDGTFFAFILIAAGFLDEADVGYAEGKGF